LMLPLSAGQPVICCNNSTPKEPWIRYMGVSIDKTTLTLHRAFLWFLSVTISEVWW
jgi:hypothetical protein